MNNMRKLIETVEQLDEGAPSGYILNSMKKWKMRITSYGGGLGCEFVDYNGKERYEEYANTVDLVFVVQAVLDDIMYDAHPKQEPEQDTSYPHTPDPYANK